MNISTERQRELLTELKNLIQDRAARESELVDVRDRDLDAIDSKYHDDSANLGTEFKAKRSGTEDAFLTRLSEARLLFEDECRNHRRDEKDVRDDLKLGRTQSLDSAKKAWRMEREHISDVNAKQKSKIQVAWAEKRAIFDQHRANLQHIQESFQQLNTKRKVSLSDEASEPQQPTANSPAEALTLFMDKLEDTRRALRRLLYLPSARFLEDGWPVLVFLVAAGGLGVLFASTLNLGAIGAGVGVLAAAAATWGLCVVLKPWVRRQSEHRARIVRESMSEAENLFSLAFDQAKSASDSELRKNEEQRDERTLECDKAFARKKDEIEAESAARKDHEANRLQQQLESINQRWDETVKSLGRQYRPELQQLEKERQKRESQLSDSYGAAQQGAKDAYDAGWGRLVDDWRSGVSAFESELGSMEHYCDEHFPEWRELREHAAPMNFDGDLAALRFGAYQIRLDDFPAGRPKHSDLQVERTEFQAPAVLSFPSTPSLLIKSHGDGRNASVSVLQNIMLRMLTAFPAGKVRFTIIDPVGLGQNFSAFMHLADFDERFVTNRIWTESNHIQQRLTDLTEHMENVIQKYLRNEFESIQQYNRNAGEVAEPFHILVVANFPANFTEESARRLASIASSGARCGVYTLISVDENAEPPRGFDLEDLEANAGVLRWDEDRSKFFWSHEELAGLPLTLENPPGDEDFSEIVKSAGELAKDASRVEVPFSIVAPRDEQYWTRDSRASIEIPLGRAGATKLQSLALGKGTSQHVLISGKTGSGKSTLLHALITNAALYYSPSEIELYLIDFKKGVEFKPYASLGLPHARVIAIESEREFGMSVLERLDQELKRRGDEFRAAGVQDLKGYRDAFPDAHVPRVLLIIDEFQEFFVKDDKIAQDASLLLDRLVRQGRAFGIHVLLGSQTLAGAYTLARSTIGQMAVRIALQCSEGDAHLILSEENTAARLLNRPGEAIYNDANGRFEGNHPFQVVWLPDEEREARLQHVSSMAEGKQLEAAPPIVFEGNALARVSENRGLRSLLTEPGPEKVAPAPRAWLGSAVAIKDPTSIVFRRQSGANLLVVGQQDETAIGVVAATILGAVAHQPTSEEHRASVRILDGTRPDAAEAGYWKSFANRLPIDIEVARPRDADAVIGDIATELDRRMTDNEDGAPQLLLVIHSLSRFRDLKKEDDFSFSFDDSASGEPTGKKLATILREGPNFGVHVIIWCDSYNNTARFLDRGSMRDLEMRVLFQMSGNDSANLMDSPAAAQLGARRAILYSDELGESEKFRPYGLPEEAFLDWVRQRLVERDATLA